MMTPDADQETVASLTCPQSVVVAPPGTGKTFTSVLLAARAAVKIYDPQRILLLTFSNNARAQLHREVRRLVPSCVRPRIEVKNYHQFFREKVWAYRRALGLPERLFLISQSERLDLLRSHLGSKAMRYSTDAVWSEALEHTIEYFRRGDSPPGELAQRAAGIIEEGNRLGAMYFDDLGYYYWKLLTRFPVIEKAMRAAYPVVIADEHQDASALQDDVVRRIARSGRRVVFADPLQLIHGWRGADESRLKRHLEEADRVVELRTMHRWSEEKALGDWLLRVRTRLLGEVDTHTAERPTDCKLLEYTRSHHDVYDAFPIFAQAIRDAFRGGHSSVAVLVPWNDHVARLRAYLTRKGMFPREIGSAEDFEFARGILRQLPLLIEAADMGALAIANLGELSGNEDRTVLDQVRKRIETAGPRLKGAGKPAQALLSALMPLWSKGRDAFFPVMSNLIETWRSLGYHVPRTECVTPIRDASKDVEQALPKYEKAVVASRFAAACQEPHGLLLMTIHQAKGKEFDAVIVGFVSTRCFPNNMDGRRLLYVAMTRGRRRISLIVPRHERSPLIDLLPV